MNEENPKETTVQKEPKKKNGKAVKIIIAIIAVVVIAAIVIGVLLLTGVIDINLNKSSKIQAGVDQLIESYSKPIEEFSNQSEESGITPKILDKINEDSEIGISTEISSNIEKIDVNGMSSSEKVAIDSVKNILNDTKLGIEARYDGDKKAYINAKGSIDDVNISGEAVYDGEQLGIRSPELNEQWLTISNNDIEDMAKENDLDVSSVKEQVTAVMNQYAKMAETLKVDEKTQEEITERYEDVLKDYIKKESKKAESEKDEIKVDGKNKKCTKLTLELNEKELKKILKSYLETFKDDKQVQDIIKKLLEQTTEMTQSLNTSEDFDSAEILDEMINEIDSLIKEIDELEIDGKAKIIIYGSSTKTYRTDIEFEAEGTKVAIQTTFNNDNTVTKILANKQEIATITLKSDKNSLNIKIEISKELQTLLGGECSLELNIKNDKSKNEMKINITAGNYGNASIEAITNINKNDDNEYDANTELKLDINLPQYAVVKMSLNMKNNIKVGDISIPTIKDNEAISITNEAEVQKYITDMEDNLNKLQEDLMKIKSLAPILESAIEDAF